MKHEKKKEYYLSLVCFLDQFFKPYNSYILFLFY